MDKHMLVCTQIVLIIPECDIILINLQQLIYISHHISVNDNYNGNSV